MSAPATQGRWSPIETAPRDGTQILACRFNGCGWEYDVIWWSRHRDEPYPWRSDHAAYAEDRHDYWQPIAPPQCGAS